MQADINNFNNNNNNNNNNNTNTNNNTNNNNHLLLDSYFRFVDNSNNSLHQILEIINAQQNSFNNLLHSSHLIRRRRHILRNNISIDSIWNRIINNRNFENNNESNPDNNSMNLNEDVNIRPSQEQIENATIECNFEDIEEPINNYCPISQIEFENSTRVIQLCQCKHIFSKNHILNWLECSVFCPLCRSDIRDNNSSDDTISPTENNPSNEYNTTPNNNTPNNTPNNNTPNDNTPNNEINNSSLPNIPNNVQNLGLSLANMINNEFLNSNHANNNFSIDFCLLPSPFNPNSTINPNNHNNDN